MSHPERYNIIIIEPSPVIQQGLKTLLEDDPRFNISHLFSDFDAFKNALIKDEAQLVLLNPSVVSVHRQFVVKNLFVKNPSALLIAILYSYVDPDTLSGFDGVLDIYSTKAQMVKKLLKVVETSGQNDSKNTTNNVDLSDREKEILISIAIGLTNKEIADKHNISIHTVVSHRKNISRKIGIKTVSGLTIYAIFNNLISENDL